MAGKSFITSWGLAGLLLIGMFSPLSAQNALEEHFPPASGSEKAEFLTSMRQKLSAIEKDLAARKQPIPAVHSLADDGVACLLDSPYLAQFSTGESRQRFLIGRLIVLNESPNTLTADLNKLRLQFGGQMVVHEDRGEPSGFASFQFNKLHQNLSELKPAKTLTVPPGHIASSWLLFPQLEAGDAVPPIQLQWTINGKPMELDVTLQCRAELGWSQEQLGPQNALSLCTISGHVNTINIGTIVDELVELATLDVSRIILRFADDAPEVDPHLKQWFLENARRAGLETPSNQQLELPMIPAMIQELHLVWSSETLNTAAHHNTPVREHATLLEAVYAISSIIYESIPVPDLLQEIREGHPLSRCAALTHGASRLPLKFFPEIRKLASQPDPAAGEYQNELQLAAVLALSEFNQVSAVELLQDLATSDQKNVPQTALKGLAISRFPNHHQGLQQLLETHPALRHQILTILAQYPRKRWADILYEYREVGEVAQQVAVLQALNQVGHPQLDALLIKKLTAPEPELQQTALELLSERNDPVSRSYLIENALQVLETTPSQRALEVITRYKVQAAIPLLLKQLKSQEQFRYQIIKTLTEIGDEQILDPLLEIYPDLKPLEKAAILRTLVEIDEKRFLDFADEALRAQETEVLSALPQILQDMPHESAVEVLMTAISNIEDQNPALSQLVMALGNISIPDSRRFLLKLRDQGTERKKQAARSALETLYYRSPANYLYQQAARTASERKNHSLAVKQYGIAIESDPYFPQAYLGRAISYHMLHRYPEALADYDHLLELDPRWPQGQAGRGHTLTAMSRFEEAIPSLDLAIEQDPDNADHYSSRAHAYSMLERFAEAERDYRKSLELNPHHMTAITGVALSLAISGEIEEAIKQLNQGKKQHGQNPVYAYNAACMYARAAEFLQKKLEEQPEQKERVIKLVDTALDELLRSQKLGYRDADWTQADPDLKVLREHERFGKILALMRGKKPDANDSDPKADEDTVE